MTAIDEIFFLWKERGGGYVGSAIINKFYRTIRPYTPQRNSYFQYGGVTIGRRKRLLDALIPGRAFADRPLFEQAVRDFQHQYVKTGDRVTVIGGGFGVTTVSAADLVGSGGRVETYEPARERYEILELTLELNEYDAEVVPHEDAVGIILEAGGDVSNSAVKSVNDLPESDVLELDCEGGEQVIIPELQQSDLRPRVIIYESHPSQGATLEQVGYDLEEIGYRLESQTEVLDPPYVDNKVAVFLFD